MRVRTIATGAVLAVNLPLLAAAGGLEVVAPTQRYLLLASTKTNTIETELNQAAALGFRVVLAAPSGVGVLFLMERLAAPPDVYRYRLHATTTARDLEAALNRAAADGYRLLPGTMLPKQKLIGPPEIVYVVERAPEGARPAYETAAGPQKGQAPEKGRGPEKGRAGERGHVADKPATPEGAAAVEKTPRYEYTVLSAAGTLDENIAANLAAGYTLVGVTTAVEHAVIMEREAPAK
jgi:hypothetical protein